MTRRSSFRLDRFDWLTISVSLLILVFFLYKPIQSRMYGDREYLGEGKILAAALKGDRPASDIYFSEGPGTVVYYTIPFLFVATDAPDVHFWRAGFIWNTLFLILALLVLRRATAMLFNGTAGKIAVVLCFLLPFHLYYGHPIASEGPAFVSIIVAAYGFTRWHFKDEKAPLKSRSFWLFLIGSTLSIMMRPNLIFFIAILGLAWLYVLYRRSFFTKYYRQGLFIATFGIAFLIGIASLITAQLAGSAYTNQQDQLDLLTYGMVGGKFPYRTELWDWRFFNEETRQGSQDYADWKHVQDSLNRTAAETGRPFKEVYFKYYISDAIEHPFLTVRQYLMKILNSHTVTVNSISPDSLNVGPLKAPVPFYLFHIVVNLINYFIIVCFLIMLWKLRRELIHYMPMLAIWLAIILFFTISGGEQRYIFTARPVFIMFTAGLISILIAKRRARKISPAAPEYREQAVT